MHQNKACCHSNSGVIWNLYCYIRNADAFLTSYCVCVCAHVCVSAGSVVQSDPTERLVLMSGRYSPVKTRNVVPHDIGDPGTDPESKLVAWCCQKAL